MGLWKENYEHWRQKICFAVEMDVGHCLSETQSSTMSSFVYLSDSMKNLLKI